MLKAPSKRKRKAPPAKLNLIPILDAVFIFIFFLLMSASFLKIYEIQSDVPIVSTAPPPKNRNPLALTIRIYNDYINVYRGVPSKFIKKINRLDEENYNLEELHDYVVKLKQKYKNERDVILEPRDSVEYDAIVKVMDVLRTLRKTDPSFFKTIKDKENNSFEERHYELFDKIVFGNIQG